MYKWSVVDVKKAFLEVLKLCRELGMVRIGKVSIDGTKFRAGASGNRIRYRKVLFKNKTSLENQVDDILKEADGLDREEEKLLGNKTEHQTGINIKEIEKKLKKMMEMRREDIEPTIGDIKRNMNFRSFGLRGKPKYLIELGLISVGHNLKKVKSWVKKIVKYQDGREKNNNIGNGFGISSFQIGRCSKIVSKKFRLDCLDLSSWTVWSKHYA